jgi:hypothetical protein
MDILKIAEHSGMQIILNARIGREEYRCVYGSLQSLQRFADALLASGVNETEDKRRGVQMSQPRSD